MLLYELFVSHSIPKWVELLIGSNASNSRDACLVEFQASNRRVWWSVFVRFLMASKIIPHEEFSSLPLGMTVEFWETWIFDYQDDYFIHSFFLMLQAFTLFSPINHDCPIFCIYQLIWNMVLFKDCFVFVCIY